MKTITIRFTVERHDYKATSSAPAHYETAYYWDGKKIAEYDSMKDVIYLNSRKIAKPNGDSIYNRALNGGYSERFRYMFDALGVDETSTLSEYMDL